MIFFWRLSIIDKDIIYGKFEFNNKSYPFFFANYIITVTQTPYEFNNDFINNYHFDYLRGVANNNKYIFFLDCDIVGGQLGPISRNLQLVCKGYVLSDSSEDCYDQIKFFSSALNAFYSPHRAIEINHKDILFSVQGLTFKNYEDTSRKFSCIINGEHIDCILLFRSSVTLKPEDSSIVSVNTTFSMKFSESKSVTKLAQYYLYLHDFLVFVNFRADVPIDNVILYKKVENEKYAKIGTAMFCQRDCRQYSADNKRSISYNDLPDKSLPNIFSSIGERREQKCYNPFFIPLDDKDARYFNSAKWLITAISFEGEFNRKYPEYKYNNDEKFKKAKDLLISTIDKVVAESEVSINNRSNAALNSFRNIISHTDTTIKEKFQFCMDNYVNEITPLIKKYVTAEGIDKDTNFSQAYSDYRNNIAHGSILPISKTEKITFQLMKCFIYALILEAGGVPREKIKDIITRMF
ncbi:MAG: hypothetical protein Q4B86_07655 [Eubacteriales bacterium]|nr:hypothetical protein [Eubacteriales bacterium]